MKIDLDVSGHAATITASTAGTNPRLCVACLQFDGRVPHLTMAQQIEFANAKRAALDDLSAVLGTMPLLVSEPPIVLAYSGCSEHRHRRPALAGATRRSS